MGRGCCRVICSDAARHGRTDGGGPRRFVESVLQVHRCTFGRIPPLPKESLRERVCAAWPTRTSCFTRSSPHYRSGGASLDPNSAVALGGAADRIAAPWDTCAGSGSR